MDNCYLIPQTNVSGKHWIITYLEDAERFFNFCGKIRGYNHRACVNKGGGQRLGYIRGPG